MQLCTSGDGDDDKENSVFEMFRTGWNSCFCFFGTKPFLPPTYGNTLQLFHNNNNMEYGNELFEGKTNSNLLTSAAAILF